MSLSIDETRHTPRASRWRQAGLFLRSWLADPIGIASIVPSGQRLAALITAAVDPAAGPVLELGPGTGVFTAALLARGVEESDLVLVEADARLAESLRERYPRTEVLRINAALLAHDDERAARRFGAAVSGLPLIWMRRPIVRDILAGTFARLAPGAALYQFTYQSYCPIEAELLDELGLVAERIAHTWRNLPPASVYAVRRSTAALGPGRAALGRTRVE